MNTTKSPKIYDIESEWDLPAFESLNLNLKAKAPQHIIIPKTPITSIKVLDLSESLLESLPDTFFDNLPGLEELNLTGTYNLQTLPKHNKKIPSFKKIYLTESFIQSLPEGFFDNLTGLVELDLKETENLQSLPKPKNPIPNLKKISLYKSSIKSLPEGWSFQFSSTSDHNSTNDNDWNTPSSPEWGSFEDSYIFTTFLVLPLHLSFL